MTIENMFILLGRILYDPLRSYLSRPYYFLCLVAYSIAYLHLGIFQDLSQSFLFAVTKAKSNHTVKQQNSALIWCFLSPTQRYIKLHFSVIFLFATVTHHIWCNTVADGKSFFFVFFLLKLFIYVLFNYIWFVWLVYNWMNFFKLYHHCFVIF